jgi:hypothetical protein
VSDRPIPVLLISGYSRSGSTLLARVLGEVDGFVAPGELRHLWRRGLVENRLCDCGEQCLDCPFWQKVLYKAFGSPLPPSLDWILQLQARVDRVYRIPALTRARSDLPAEVASYLSYYEHLYAAIEELTGATCIVDSSKDPSFGHVLALSDVIDLSVIHLVRDSRAVAHSWTRKKHDPGTGKQMKRQHPLQSALEWNVAQWAARRLTRRVPHSMTLRYESFAAEPESAVRRALDLVGEDAEVPVQGHKVHLGRGHAVSGNPMRFESGMVGIDEDNAWQKDISRSSRALVTALTWPGLHSHGYLD